MLKRYVKRPVECEAILWDGTNVDEIWDEFGAQNIYGPTEETTDIIVTTLEGPSRAPVGWYIVRGIEGELYPCKPSIFEATHDEAV